MIIINAVRKRIISFMYLMVNKYILRKNIMFKNEELVSLSTNLNISKTSKLTLGKKVGTRKNVEFSASNEGEIIIGDNCFFNNNCIVASHKKISIGEGCSFGPNVMIYDHDHDFRAPNGLKSNKFKTSEVIIGKNVWIGANSVVLRGTIIEDNCVIGAGCVVNGHLKAGHILVNERNQKILEIN